jgi:hypothetical protein
MLEKLNKLATLLNMASTRGVTKDHMRLLIIQAQGIVQKLRDENVKEKKKSKADSSRI